MRAVGIVSLPARSAAGCPALATMRAPSPPGREMVTLEIAEIDRTMEGAVAIEGARSHAGGGGGCSTEGGGGGGIAGGGPGGGGGCSIRGGGSVGD